VKKQTEHITKLMKSDQKKQKSRRAKGQEDDEDELPYHVKMQRIEDSVVSSTSLSRDEVRWIISMFDFFDTDRDQLISREEALLLFSKMGYVPVMPLGTQLTLMQFLLVAGLQKAQLFDSSIQGSAKHTFRMITGDQGGRVTSKMLEKHMSSIGIPITKMSAERITEIVSAEGDLEFSEMEFVEYLTYNHSFLENLKRKKEQQKRDNIVSGTLDDTQDGSGDDLSDESLDLNLRNRKDW